MKTMTTQPEAHATPDFWKNIYEMPESIWRPYVDQFVAYSLDGKQILAGAPKDADVEPLLVAKGIDPSQVIFAYVDDPAVMYLSPFVTSR